MLLANDSSVTISIEFKNNPDTSNYNPKLKQSGDNTSIKELNIRAYYYGNLDVKVNYIQIETPMNNDLLWGETDNYIID